MEGLAGVDGCLGFFAGALQAREALENRHADFFSAAGVDGGLDDHQVTGLECLADQFAGRFQVAQIRAFVGIDRRRDGNNEDAAVAQVGRLAAKAQLGGLCQALRATFPGAVTTALQFLDAPGRYRTPG